MSRRKSRVVAFQGVYSWNVGGISEEDVLKLNWTAGDPDFVASKEESEEEVSDFEKSVEPGLDEETAAFSRMIIAGTIQNCDAIDLLIKENLKNWSFERVNKVSVAILRTSIYQLMFVKDIPQTVVIDEAVDIAKNYGPEDSYKFVNAILDKVCKKLSEEK